MRILLLLLSFIATAAGQSLLDNHALQGSVRRSFWTTLSTANPRYRINNQPPYYYYSDDPWTMTGLFTVAAPGYSANAGLYSWTGPYSVTTSQATADFDIQHAVFQLDLVWDPGTSFPVNGGPKLNYNGGNQQLTAMPMIVGRSRQTQNNTGIPEMEHLDSFVYRGITWQWDLSQIEVDINSVSIVMPFANHTAVSGARIDVASEFAAIGGTSLSPLALWRDTYFQTTGNTGDAADNADPDGDGLVNLVEYALGTRPENTDGEQGSASAPATDLAGGRLKLAFKIPSVPPAEITYRVWVTSDLVSWKTLATKAGTAAWAWNGDGPSQITSEPSLERQRFTIGDEIPSTGTDRRFMRLEISR